MDAHAEFPCRAARTRSASSPTTAVLAASLLAIALPLRASVTTGDSAPDFSVPAEMHGRPFALSLSDALQRGPVVLIFASAQVVAGCDGAHSPVIEAAAEYRDFNATVVGISRDAAPGVTAACRSPIPVASDPGERIASAYGVAEDGPRSAATYVIAPDGTVLHRESDPVDDTQAPQRTLDVLREWVARAKPDA